MKKILILSFVFTACLPVGRISPYPDLQHIHILIGNGDSRISGAYRLDVCKPSDLLPFPMVQIMCNDTYLYENLQMGVNNCIDHAGFPNSRSNISLSEKRGGWELGVAKRVTNHPEIYKLPLRYVSTGQGFSSANDWANYPVDCNPYCHELPEISMFWTKFKKPAERAIQLLNGKSYDITVAISAGTNDAIGGATSTSYKANMLKHIGHIRQYFGSNTVIIIVKLQPFSTLADKYNNVIMEICKESTNIRYVDVAGLPRLDVFHENYVGQDSVANRILRIAESYWNISVK